MPSAILRNREPKTVRETPNADRGSAMKNAALYTAGTVFAVVSAAHGLRFLRGDEVIAGGITIPLGLSLAAGLVLFALAVWMFIAARR